MAFESRDITISPFCPADMSLQRASLGFFSPCPDCGKLVRRSYRSKQMNGGFSVQIVMDCPECGTSVVESRIEGTKVEYLTSDGRPYDSFAHLDGLESRVRDASDDESTLALLYAEAAWEDLSIIVKDVHTLWTTAVDHMVAALKVDTSRIRDIASWVVRFIAIEDGDILFDTLRACRAVVEAVPSPTSPQECVVWMAYLTIFSDPGLGECYYDHIEFVDQDQYEELLTSQFSIAEEAAGRFIEDGSEGMPLFPVIECICRHEFYVSEGREESSYDSASYLDDLIRVVGDVMDGGAEMSPALFARLQHEWSLEVSCDWNESGGIGKISTLRGRMGWYNDALDGYLMVLEACVNLNGEFNLLFTVFRGDLHNEPRQEDMDLLEEGVKLLEGYPLDVVGVSLSTAYAFFGFAEKCLQFLEVALQYSESLRENLLPDQSNAAFLNKVYGTLTGKKRAPQNLMSRSVGKKEKKPSKKDCIAAKKAAHKAKRK